MSQLLSAIGLGLVVASIFWLNEKTPFPSFYTFLPTGWTALIIIFAYQGTLVKKLLSNKLLVGIGLISYSAYLWHHPLLAFTRIYNHNIKLDGVILVTLIAITFILAYMSWRFVEKPFRNRYNFNQRIIFALSGSFVFILASIGLIGHFSKGGLNRFDLEIKELLNFRTQIIVDTRKEIACRLFNETKLSEYEKLNSCFQNGQPFVYLIGDSHAGHIDQSVRSGLFEENIGLINIRSNSCLPIPGTTLPAYDGQVRCDKTKKLMYEYIEKRPAPVIISSRWRANVTGEGFDNGEGGIEVDSYYPSVVVANKKQPIDEYIIQSINGLSKKFPIIIINQIPEAGWDVPYLLARRYLRGIRILVRIIRFTLNIMLLLTKFLPR